MPSCLSLSARDGNTGGNTTLCNGLISLLFLASFLLLPFQCPKLCTSPGKSGSCLHLIHLLECPRLWPPPLPQPINMLPYMLWFPETEVSHSSFKTQQNPGGTSFLIFLPILCVVVGLSHLKDILRHKDGEQMPTTTSIYLEAAVVLK